VSRFGKLPERNLDILRAVAVLCVLLNHVASVLWPGTVSVRPARLVPWYMLGRAGVLIFFVHTSYVLMGSLDRMRAHGLTGWSLAGVFYTRRAFRIYPLAIATVLLVYFAQLPVGPEPWSQPVAAGGWILSTNLALIQNLTATPSVLGVLWSLPIEVQMYLVLPVLGGALRRFTSFRMLLGWVGAMVLALVAISAVGESLLDHRLDLLLFAPCFVAGAIAYHLSARSSPRLPSAAWLPVLLILLFVFAAVPIVRVSADVGLPAYPWAWALSAIVAAGLILVRNSGESRLSSTAHTIAKYSYGIYLTHVPVLAFATRIWPATRTLSWWIVVLAGLAAAAWAAYRFIEAPGIRLGQHLTRGRPDLASYAPAP
jgi:peptidoglycan/LPS O-acetylase OafA/YrhL